MEKKIRIIVGKGQLKRKKLKQFKERKKSEPLAGRCTINKALFLWPWILQTLLFIMTFVIGEESSGWQEGESWFLVFGGRWGGGIFKICPLAGRGSQ